MSNHTQQALLSLTGIVRTLREEAEEARTNGAQIEPVALEHHAALLDKARDAVAFEYEQRLTNDDTVWLKTVMKSLARCVKSAEKTGCTIGMSEIRAVIEVVNDARVQGGAQ
ncbi:hypothetical protein [Vreelandella olivaria]|uniref:hypothetical protein n=1 Tax=Vreelandella olivaria TaxID=390919 RepID=UPI00201F041F|nr:hypothetical protein [Halomonas olivaria]